MNAGQYDGDCNDPKWQKWIELLQGTLPKIDTCVFKE